MKANLTSERICVLPPSAADAAITRRLLAGAGLTCHICADMPDLCDQIQAGAGAVLLTGDALARPEARTLANLLEREPAWSDLPVIMLSRRGTATLPAAWAIDELGATILERPVRTSTLLSVLRTALQSRRRQYQVRDQLSQLEAAAAALRESENRFRIMADELPLIIWLHDDHGRQQFVNQTLCEYFGVDRAHMRDDRWELLTHPDDRQQYSDAFAIAVRNRQPFLAETRVRRADGQWRWLTSWARPRFAPDGTYLGHIGASADITERRHAEQELERTRNELEQRVAERTRELERRAAQLARLTSELTLAEQRERQRLARILHDHLQQLLASASLGLGFLSSGDAQRRAQWIEHVRSCIDESTEAARDLSIELSPPVLHEAGLVAGLQWLARWMREKHGLEVQCALDPGAEPQREDVRTLVFESVRELLFNVVKHAGVRHAVVELAGDEHDCLRVLVADEGAGFDPARLAGPDDAAHGFGLFSIRERLAHLGGSFEVHSEPGCGSRFTIVAPCASQAGERQLPLPAMVDSFIEPAAALAEPQPVRPGLIRVLIVDDHNLMRDGLRTLLSEDAQLGVVGEASDGVEAIELARRLRPDIILMDCSMPRMNGADATRHIRREMPDIQIIALSMYHEADRAAEMIEAGAAAYVSKSGGFDALVDRICAVHADRSLIAGQ